MKKKIFGNIFIKSILVLLVCLYGCGLKIGTRTPTPHSSPTHIETTIKPSLTPTPIHTITLTEETAPTETPEPLITVTPVSSITPTQTETLVQSPSPLTKSEIYGEGVYEVKINGEREYFEILLGKTTNTNTLDKLFEKSACFYDDNNAFSTSGPPHHFIFDDVHRKFDPGSQCSFDFESQIKDLYALVDETKNKKNPVFGRIIFLVEIIPTTFGDERETESEAAIKVSCLTGTTTFIFRQKGESILKSAGRENDPYILSPKIDQPVNNEILLYLLVIDKPNNVKWVVPRVRMTWNSINNITEPPLQIVKRMLIKLDKESSPTFTHEYNCALYWPSNPFLVLKAIQQENGLNVKFHAIIFESWLSVDENFIELPYE